MALALIPILAIAFLGWFWFDPATFLAGWNVSGGSDMHAIRGLPPRWRCGPTWASRAPACFGGRHREPEAQHAARDAHRARRSPPSSTC